MLFAVLGLYTTQAIASSVYINEYTPNPTGTEASTSFFEFLGTPGENMDGLSLISVSNNATGSLFLEITDVFDFTASHQFDVNGIVNVQLNISNPSHTVILTDNANNLIDGQDLDPDENGAIDDLSIFGAVVDALGVADSAADQSTLFADELLPGDPMRGIDLGFNAFNPFSYNASEPELVFRDRITLDLYQAASDLSVILDVNGNILYENLGTPSDLFDIAKATPGSINPSLVPVPTASLSGALGLVFLVGRRRR